MEKKVQVDWNKWEKQEWPKYPYFVSSVLCIAIFIGGVLVDWTFPALFIGFISGYLSLKIINRLRDGVRASVSKPVKNLGS